MADPYAPLRALVTDPIKFRVLRGYIQHRRDPATSEARALEVMCEAIKAGRDITPVLHEAAKPEPIWGEERALTALVLRTVRPLAGHSRSPETLTAIWRVVGELCAKRYPNHRARYVHQVVRANVAHTLTRLEIRIEPIVAALAGFRRLH